MLHNSCPSTCSAYSKDTQLFQKAVENAMIHFAGSVTSSRNAIRASPAADKQLHDHKSHLSFWILFWDTEQRHGLLLRLLWKTSACRCCLRAQNWSSMSIQTYFLRIAQQDPTYKKWCDITSDYIRDVIIYTLPTNPPWNISFMRHGTTRRPKSMVIDCGLPYTDGWHLTMTHSMARVSYPVAVPAGNIRAVEHVLAAELSGRSVEDTTDFALLHRRPRQ